MKQQRYYTALIRNSWNTHTLKTKTINLRAAGHYDVANRKYWGTVPADPTHTEERVRTVADIRGGEKNMFTWCPALMFKERDGKRTHLHGDLLLFRSWRKNTCM